MDTVLRRYAPGTVPHFATHTEVGEPNRVPLNDYRNNVGGLMSLADTTTRHGVDRIVFSSTAAANRENVSASDDAAMHPGNRHGATKLTGDKVLAVVAATGALRYAALR